MVEKTYQYDQKELLGIRNKIARFVEENTVVKDFDSGYVFCEPLNHAVSPNLLKEAAQVINGIFLSKLPPELQPTKVIGVPNRGKELAVALGLETGLTIGVTERVETNGVKAEKIRVTHNEENDMVIIDGIRSFTKPGKVFSHMIRALRPGDRVLVADDFSAYGHVTDQYTNGFHELDITPIFVYLAAKDFGFLNPPQTGYRRHKEKGDCVFTVIRLTSMTGGAGGRVKATAADI